ncbi:HNH endonuclease [Lentzea sp. NPDC051213]|uniref:HNH endonuclease n=1 Tax=Lentzea sp. NPDC051213 TaxID=3364126 RepID=UPI0037A37EBC
MRRWRVQAWSLLVAEGERRFAGNEGYEDVPDSYYLYDSGVANHLNVNKGDLVVLRTNAGSLGVAKIEDIEVEENHLKKRLRCPFCKKMRFNERKFAEPKYMCRREGCQGYVEGFNQAAESMESVTRFRAIYQGTWRPLTGALTAAELDAVALTKSKQNAIRKLDVEGVERLLRGVKVPLPPTPPAGAAPTKPIAAGVTTSLVKVRTGQQEFRKALLERYGLVCLITGPAPEQALQAAHLRAFAEHRRHLPEEGALLRADIHQLFDKGMIAVDPGSLTVAIDPRLRDYGTYAALAGKSLEVPREQVPCLEALSDHYTEATSRWVQIDVSWRSIEVEGLTGHR